MDQPIEDQADFNKAVSKALRALYFIAKDGKENESLEPFHILMNNIDAYAFRSEYAAMPAYGGPPSHGN